MNREKNMFSRNQKALAFVTGALLSLQSFAADLTEVSFTALSAEELQAVLTFDGEAPAASGYLMESPARLVVDLPDTVNAVDQRRFSLSGSVATDAMLLSNSDKTRLVFNLTEQSTYEMLTRGNTVSLVIATEGTRTSNAVPTSAAYLPQQAAASSDALSGFDFRRGSEGEANILIDLGNSNASVDVDTVGSDMVITIPNYSVPDHLQSRMDVLDFGTPVSYVIIDQVGDDAQITIETQDVFDFSAYQADDQLVLSVAPLTEQQVAERDAMTFEGEKLSFNFQNIEIRSMLQIIADVAELNLVASDTVQGEITLRLVNVPWDQALDIVLRTKGLDKRLVGNVLMVAPAAEIADRERIELENTQKMQDLAPVYTEHFRVNYADAEEINTLFQAMSDDTTSGLLSGRGSAIVDQRTNSIIMTDTQAKLDEFRDLLEKLDIPVRQVSIEARIVLANAGVSRDIGVRWGYDYRNGAGNGGTGISTGSIDGIVDIVNGDPISYGDAPGGLVVDLAASPSSASSFAVGLLTGDNNFLTLELSALEAEGRGEVISQPRVIAGNQQKAIIQSGSEIPYQQATSSGATAVQFKEATLKLEVTPLITPDNRIIMELVVTKDSIGEVVAGVPTIDVTQLETSVIADNGQTIVLGGIFEQAVVESEEKTPILGDIPFLGNLFKRTSRSNDKRETLIFITPRIMDEPTATQ